MPAAWLDAECARLLPDRRSDPQTAPTRSEGMRRGARADRIMDCLTWARDLQKKAIECTTRPRGLPVAARGGERAARGRTHRRPPVPWTNSSMKGLGMDLVHLAVRAARARPPPTRARTPTRRKKLTSRQSPTHLRRRSRDGASSRIRRWRAGPRAASGTARHAANRSSWRAGRRAGRVPARRRARVAAGHATARQA